MNLEQKAQALELVQREALYLDEQRWPDWLGLYLPDSVFWVPMWTSESTLTSDPDTELSFIYLDGLARLEERVHRVLSGRAVSSLPIPRTSHLVGPGLATGDEGGCHVTVQSAWRCLTFLHKDNQAVEHAGRYTHELERVGEDYRIRRKTVVLTNDHLPSQLDFFYV